MTGPRWACKPEQLRLLERLHTDFVRAGAALGEREQEQLRALNERLSTLTSTFSTRLLAETRDLAVHVQDRAELDGLAEDAVAAAAQAARTRGLDGYLITLVLPTAQPALASLTNRALRRRLHEAAVSRGLRGNEHDTREVITEIAALRAERAALLGFADHASYVVADRTAGTVEAVASMLGALVGPAVATPGPRRPSWRRRCTRTGTRGRWSRGTGRSTPNGSRRHGSTVDEARAAAVLRAAARPARRCLPRRHRAVRDHVRPAARPARLPPAT